MSLHRQRPGGLPSRQNGLTIVEIMVSLLLGLLLLAGTIQIFLATRQSYLTTEASARLQENGRFAMNFLSGDTRMAGFFGCGSTSGVNFYNGVDFAKWKASTGATSTPSAIFSTFDGTGGINGYDNVNTIAAGSELDNLGLSVGTGTGQVVAGTDVLLMRSGKSCPGGDVVCTGSNCIPDTANIKIKDATACGLEKNDIVLVTDCKNADLFSITNNPQSAGGSKDTLAHGSSLNLTSKLSSSYGPDAMIFGYNMSLFYVALYRKRFSGTGHVLQTQELVEGIQDMQILYGVDTTGANASGDYAPDYYVPASSISAADMEKVVAVRIQLTAYTINTLVDVHSPDRRLHRTFVTTITLRNRVH